MRFSYNHGSADPGVRQAVEFAAQLGEMEGFWQAVAEAAPFTQTDSPSYTPRLIAERMRGCKDVVEVRHFRSLNPASSTTAYVDPDTPFCIFLNTRKFGRSVAEKVNTLVHEFVHVVDCFRDGPSSTRTFEYTHTTHWTAERPNSAPYWIGNLAQEWWNLAHQQEFRGKDALVAVSAAEPRRDYASISEFACSVSREPGDIEI